MKAETNHIFIGREDRLTQWAGITEENDVKKELAERRKGGLSRCR